MPKGKRKGKSDRGRYNGSVNTSDEESYNDNVSVISSLSENRSVIDGDETEEAVLENFEEKLIEILDGFTHKSSQSRTTSIQTLSKAFVKRFIPSFIRERHFTICDGVERGLKKGGNEEKIAAAELASLICIQLGEEDASELVSKALQPILITTIGDKSISPIVRAKCCTALGIIGFITGNELADVLSLMQIFENIFSASYFKGDGSVPTITAEVAILHAAALNSWILLLTNLRPESISSFIKNKTFPSLGQLSELLESAHLEIRLAAGEALALIFEEGRKVSDDFAEDFALTIIDTFKKLATDSHKYRAKKDRKQQRATFRDILQFFEDDSVPEVQVKFVREILYLDTWGKRKQYEALCNLLGPGINTQLTENDLLRSIFEITSPAIVTTPTPNQLQVERQQQRLICAAAAKARTISRGKNRDKRSEF